MRFISLGLCAYFHEANFILLIYIKEQLFLSNIILFEKNHSFSSQHNIFWFTISYKNRSNRLNHRLPQKTNKKDCSKV